MNHNATCVFRYVLYTICMVFGVTAINNPAHGQMSSVTSGNWNNPQTWGQLSNVPGPTDAVSIMAGHTVTVTDVSPGYHQCRTLTIGRGNGSAVLTFAAGGILNVYESVTVGGGTAGEDGVLSFANGGLLTTPQLIAGNAPGSSVVCGSGTVELTGSGDVTLPATLFSSFHRLIINKISGTVTLNRDISVTGNWVSNAPLNPAAYTVTFSGSGNQSIGGSAAAHFHNLVNNCGGVLTLDQDISLSGNWTNNAVINPGTKTVTWTGSTAQSLSGTTSAQFHHFIIDKSGSSLTINADIAVSGNWTNNWALALGAGIVTFTGNGNQTIGGSAPTNFSSVTLQKSGGTIALTDNAATVSGTLTLSNGVLSLGNYDLILGSAAGGSSASYICTNGTGAVKRSVNNSDVVFPIGTPSGYNPVTINNSGLRDAFLVSVKESLDHPLYNNAYVNRQWMINEQNPGGSNAQITLQWKSGDEPLTGFNRTGGLYLFHYSTGWSNVSANYTDLGNGVYTATASGFTSFSPFAVGNIGAVPVELTSFTARYFSPEVRLSWTTATELNNFGFEVERSGDGVIWDKVAFVEGAGNSYSPKHYSYVDDLGDHRSSGTMAYRLRQIDRDGTMEYSKIVYVMLGPAPTAMKLHPAYPNPFNPTTTLSYSLPESTMLSVRVYNVYGQEVSTLLDAAQSDAGFHTLDFNGAGLPSGSYIVRFEAQGRILQQQVVLSK